MTDDRALGEFAEVMRRLRAECPWKRAQTHRSLVRYLLEETYETVEAVDAGEESGDWSHLREELGDLLLQVFFHAVVAEERGVFTLGDVATDITAKMRRRNPHVFGDADPDGLDAAAVDDLWEHAKAAEKQRDSVTEGIPAGLPALLYADKVLGRLRRAEPSADSAAPPLTDPADDQAVDPRADPHTDLGERLLALVAEARADGVDPEQALRDAVRRRL